MFVIADCDAYCKAVCHGVYAKGPCDRDLLPTLETDRCSISELVPKTLLVLSVFVVEG